MRRGNAFFSYSFVENILTVNLTKFNSCFHPELVLDIVVFLDTTAKMRDACMLSFTKEQIITAGEYCANNSSALPVSIREQIKFTDKLHKDEVVMAPSESQCSWLMSFTQALRPKRSRLLSF
jgi:hypothetical protein